MLQWLKAFAPRLCSTWMGLCAATLTTASGLGILLLIAAELVWPTTNDYASLFLLMALTAFFAVGLVLIPISLRKRPAHASGGIHAAGLAQRVVLVAAGTVVSIATMAAGGGTAFHEMSTPQFCGTACHIPMQPVWDAYQRSPHARVDCVTCHVGSGAVWGVRAKLDGVKRLKAMITHDYARPIPTPVHGMRAAADTCEKCHSPAERIGDRVKVYPHYGEQRENKPAFNVAVLFVGGAQDGIHAHAGGQREIRYEMLDETRTHIGKIRVVEAGQVVAEYSRPGEQRPVVRERRMDCLDCHNQPAHQFTVSARAAVDAALYAGQLDPRMPYVSAVATALLADAKTDREGAPAYFDAEIRKAYASRFPEEKVSDSDLQKVSRALSAIYLRNIFPAMNTQWGAYPSHNDHHDPKDETGCFRCHNSDYEAAMLAPGRKKKLNQSCEACHTMVATEEDPAEMDDLILPLVRAPPSGE